MVVEVTSETLKPLVAYLREVSKNSERALRRAVSSSARATRTIVRDAIAENYTAKKRRIAQDIKAKTEPAKLSFTIIGSRKRIGLTGFDFRATSKGVNVRIKRGGRLVNKPHAFMAETKNFGVEGSSKRVFERKTFKRLPIKVQFGPAVADMMVDSITNDAIFDRGLEKMRTELARQIAVALRDG